MVTILYPLRKLQPIQRLQAKWLIMFLSKNLSLTHIQVNNILLKKLPRFSIKNASTCHFEALPRFTQLCWESTSMLLSEKSWRTKPAPLSGVKDRGFYAYGFLSTLSVAIFQSKWHKRKKSWPLRPAFYIFRVDYILSWKVLLITSNWWALDNLTKLTAYHETLIVNCG